MYPFQKFLQLQHATDADAAVVRIVRIRDAVALQLMELHAEAAVAVFVAAVSVVNDFVARDGRATFAGRFQATFTLAESKIDRKNGMGGHDYM